MTKIQQTQQTQQIQKIQEGRATAHTIEQHLDQDDKQKLKFAHFLSSLSMRVNKSVYSNNIVETTNTGPSSNSKLKNVFI